MESNKWSAIHDEEISQRKATPQVYGNGDVAFVRCSTRCVVYNASQVLE